MLHVICILAVIGNLVQNGIAAYETIACSTPHIVKLYYDQVEHIENADDATITRLATVNSGNLIWAHAAGKLLDYNRVKLISLWEHGCSVMLFPTANLLHGAETGKKWAADTIEERLKWFTKINPLPILTVGIGTQFSFPGELNVDWSTNLDDIVRNATIETLSSESLRLLAVLEARTPWFYSVRGQITHRAIVSAGFSRAAALGGPSQFLYTGHSLERTLKTGFEAVLSRPMSDLTIAASLGEAYHGDVVKFLYDVVQKSSSRSHFVLARREDQARVSDLQRQLSISDPEMFSRVALHYDVGPWLKAMSSLDLVIGARIHQVMAGIAVGVPGVLIAMDYRQIELGRAMGVPMVLPSQIKRSLSLNGENTFEKVIRFAAAQVTGLDENRRRNAIQYVTMLRSAGLFPSPNLLRIARKPYNHTAGPGVI